MAEPSLRRGDSLERGLDMSPDLACLAVEALSAPAPDVLLQVVPDETIRHPTGCGDGPEVGQPVDRVENLFLCCPGTRGRETPLETSQSILVSFSSTSLSTKEVMAVRAARISGSLAWEYAIISRSTTGRRAAMIGLER